MPIRLFEPESTVQFTFVSSVAPDNAPLFSVTDEQQTVVASFTAIQSDDTHYYALFTLPNSYLKARYVATWKAVKTFNGSERNFIARLPFMGIETKV